jgi:hypothetical protein
MDRMIMQGVVWMAALFAAACAPATGESDTAGDLFLGEEKASCTTSASNCCYAGESKKIGECNSEGQVCKDADVAHSGKAWFVLSASCPTSSSTPVSSGTTNAS